MKVELSARLKGIHAQLIGGYSGGDAMSSATKGYERENFVENFMSRVFPPHFRFGRGDIMDASTRSGQIDVVLEYPFTPSLPMLMGNPRLYLAEGVAAAIEVKSDLAAKWDEVVETAKKVKALTRDWSGSAHDDSSATAMVFREHIKFFAVGYTGWKTKETLESHMKEQQGVVDGALVIDPGIYCQYFAPTMAVTGFTVTKGKDGRAYGQEVPIPDMPADWKSSQGADASLWALISALHKELLAIKFAQIDLDRYL